MRMAVRFGLIAIVIIKIGVSALYHKDSFAISDEAAYLQTARSLARENKLSVPKYRNAYHMNIGSSYVDLGNIMISKYPPGYPFLLSLFYRIGGHSWTGLLNLTASLFTIVMIFLLGRNIFDSYTGFLGAVVYSFGPTAMFFDQTYMSHTLSTALTAAALFAALKGSERHKIYLFLSGLLAGSVIFVRYSDIIPASAGLALILIQPKTSMKERIKGAVFFAAGFGLVSAFFLLFNCEVWGDPFRTGYFYTQEQSAFLLSLFHRRILFVLKTVFVQGIPYISLFAAPAILILAFKNSRYAIFYTVWILPLLLLYSCYYWKTPSYSVYSRFLMPVLPGVALLSVYFIFTVCKKLKISLGWTGALLIFLYPAIAFRGFHESITEYNKRSANDLIEWVESNVQKNSLLYSDTNTLTVLSYFFDESYDFRDSAELRMLFHKKKEKITRATRKTIKEEKLPPVLEAKKQETGIAVRRHFNAAKLKAEIKNRMTYLIIRETKDESIIEDISSICRIEISAKNEREGWSVYRLYPQRVRALNEPAVSPLFEENSENN